MIERNGKKYFKVALHQHTTRSDGRLTPEEVIKEYKADGYDAVAFTDHWVYHGGGYIDGLLTISGCEYNLGIADTIEGVMHILGLGMKEEPKINRDGASRQDVIDEIVRCSGIAVLAHPAWSLNTVKDAKELSGVYLTEIYNAVSEAHESERAYSDYFVDVMANEGIYYGLLATDDAHYYDGTDNRHGFVMVMADELTEESIIRGIKEGNFFASQGPEIYAEINDGRLIIDTTPANKIITFSNKSFAKSRTLRGEGLTHFEYEIKPEDVWLRAEVRDSFDRRAYTNIFIIKK